MAYLSFSLLLAVANNNQFTTRMGHRVAAIGCCLLLLQGGDGFAMGPPAGGQPPPPKAAPPDYKKLLGDIMGVMEGALPLERSELPAAVSERESTVGKGASQTSARISISAWSAKSTPLRHIRAAYLITDSGTAVLNFVAFPHVNVDIPVFSIDLVSLPGGHLVFIDLQPAAPLSENPELERHYEGLDKVLSRYQDKGLPWGGDLPVEVQPFCSPCCLWSKVQDEKVVEDLAFTAALEYLSHYLVLVNAAQADVAAPRRQALSEGHLAYGRYRRDKDPAKFMLQRFFGEEWTTAVLSDVLYDLDARVLDGTYSVSSS
jgi:phycoerythrobilin:ferredoxin oxidoreductase